jgi:hypothetical protein
LLLFYTTPLRVLSKKAADTIQKKVKHARPPD